MNRPNRGKKKMSVEEQRNINLISCEFKQILRNCNDSSFDQLEFRSLESNCFKVNTKAQSMIKDSSYSEAIRAFVKKINDRNLNKSIDENKKISKLASSTPFKKCDIIKYENCFNISGIANLELTSAQKEKIERSELLNDSDFESMDQDQYDDDDDDDNTKENVNNENVKKFFSSSNKKSKSVDKIPMSHEKFRKCSSPFKGRKNKLKKLKQMKNNSQTYLRYEQSFNDDQSLANIITTDSISRIESESLKVQLNTLNKSEYDTKDDLNDTNFAFTQPNKTESFEASIKNLTQLSVSNSLHLTIFLV